MGNKHALVTKNNITIKGNGSKVLFLVHGFGCDQTMWRYIVPAFEKDCTIVMIDLMGFGQSDEIAYTFDKYNSLESHTDDIVAICDTYAFADITIIGYSIGAMIAMGATFKRPHIFKQLILLSGSPRYMNDESGNGQGYLGGLSEASIDELLTMMDANYLGWASSIVPAILGNQKGNEVIIEELTNSICRSNPKIAKQFARLTFTCDYRDSLNKVVVPTLILQSADDMIAPLAVGNYLHSRIPGSTMAVLDTIGHCPHLLVPEKIVAEMEAFMN
ncbi:alpha/beta fold hydrolase [Parasediminibacterium sp. JCM 36343]|uniref:alpha/beta fold hydrolase n=1 Tax=Parasediminibacterium sp. JCM 36343 TaxID=3374279 RepID=UPI00397AE7E7